MRKIVALLLVLLMMTTVPVMVYAFGTPDQGAPGTGGGNDSGTVVDQEKKDFMAPTAPAEGTTEAVETETVTIPTQVPTETASAHDSAMEEAHPEQESAKSKAPMEAVEERTEEESFGKRLFFQKTGQTELWKLIVPAIGAAAALAALYILRKKSGK